jgi:hypothetical protein
MIIILLPKWILKNKTIIWHLIIELDKVLWYYTLNCLVIQDNKKQQIQITKSNNSTALKEQISSLHTTLFY